MTEERREKKEGGGAADGPEPVARSPVVIIGDETGAAAAPDQPDAAPPPAVQPDAARHGFDVIFTGGVAVGSDVEVVKRDLMATFELGRAEVEDLFSGRETVIATDADRKTASDHIKAWEAVGAICRLEPHAGPRASRPMPVALAGEDPSGSSTFDAQRALPGPATPPPKALPSQTPPPPTPPPQATLPEPRPPQTPPPQARPGQQAQQPGEPLTARVITPHIGPSDAMFSPIRCIRVTREERGLGILGPLGQEQRPISDVLIVSVFENVFSGQRKVQMLFFVKGLRRPYVVDAAAINFASFTGVTGKGEHNALRNLVRMLTMMNPRIMIDQVTAQFVEGWAPEKFGKDPILLATALAQFLQEGSRDSERDSVILTVKRRT